MKPTTFRIPDRIVLASSSPRRRELLSAYFPHHEVHPAEIDEESQFGLDPAETAERLSMLKLEAVRPKFTDALVIAGDTIVAVDQQLLSKPIDEADAFRMLRSLSGRRHLVLSGLAIAHLGQTASGVARTEVSFRDLSDDEIRDYIATGQPMDKAGAYGLQDSSHSFCDGLNGSMSNVIGFPKELFEQLMSQLGVAWER